MLAGLLVRGYKVYKHVKFIPFFEQRHENLVLFIGGNGVGKSSILEALNTFFNNASWTLTTGVTDAYIVPVLLIDKSKIANFHSESKEFIEKISNFLWEEVTKESNKKTTGAIPNFFDFKDSIKISYKDTHYLLMLGVASKVISDDNPQSKKAISFGIFDSQIKKEVLGLNFEDEEEKILRKADNDSLNRFLKDIQEHYTYIYVPTETNVAEFLRLEGNEMQRLIDKKIVDNIDRILTAKNIVDNSVPTVEGKENVPNDILTILNDKLLPYVEEIEAKIKTIDSTYKFTVAGPPGSTAVLTAKDINRQIIRTFYAKRTLTKGTTPIHKLSSGERKKVLIDIAYSILSQREGQQEKEIILAIDEPEASLDMSIRYQQFETIEKLANICNVFIATHWYGALPIIQNGLIEHIEKGENDVPNVRVYKAQSYFENRINEPYDIYFKSFSELAQSILTSIKVKDTNWIIVEGPEDRNYIKYHLNGNVTNLKILPVGGCGSVKVLYQHLYLSISLKSERSNINGQVFCLVDTDSQIVDIDHSDTKNNILCIRRLNRTKKHGEEIIELARLESDVRHATAIEDTLMPKQFYDALKSLIEETGSTEVKEAFKGFEFNPTANFSEVEGVDAILNPIPSVGRHSLTDKKTILEFIKHNKFAISEKYCALSPADNNPVWIGEILKFFSPPIVNPKPAVEKLVVDINKNIQITDTLEVPAANTEEKKEVG